VRCRNNDLVGMADALADLVLVINGFAATMGLPFNQIVDAVNTANHNGKRLVTSRGESRRGFEYDLVKTINFQEPKSVIKVIIERELKCPPKQ
jgi:predicted HAD superfamily Cof-like phosphohydrolase